MNLNGNHYSFLFPMQSSSDLLAPDKHLQIAREAISQKRYFFAFAELQTALLLGGEAEEIRALIQVVRECLPERTSISHNQFYRFQTLATEIAKLANGARISVLDVGGGEGQLASFIQDHEYCLAEPTLNGISGLELPFVDKSFDVVVACHVLEHIAFGERENFLDNLLSKARHNLVLLNPFQVPGFNDNKALRSIIDITGAQWAKEHLECSLPQLESIYEYAYKRGLSVRANANGTLATTIAIEFMDFMADGAGAVDKWKMINQSLNEQFSVGLDSATFPTAFLISLSRNKFPEPKSETSRCAYLVDALNLVEKYKNINNNLVLINLQMEKLRQSSLIERSRLENELNIAETQLLFLKELMLDDDSNHESL